METFYILTVLSMVGLDFVRTSEPVDNSLFGDPEIQCTSDSVKVHFKTYNIFEGHIYVKGHYDKPGCRVDASNDRSASIEIPFTNCGVRRERSADPPGLLVSAILVVSFHPMFVTKTDKAFHVKCFYLTSEKPVTTGLDVSMFSTQMVTQNSPTPVCKYEVLDNGPNGSTLKYAVVGQDVYHKWSCESEIKDIYCMTIHSCFVDDGNNRKTQLLDENGCAQDKYLMSNLFYDEDLQGGVTNLVFKYADKPTVFFQCQIRLHYKDDPFSKCQRTSDHCPWPTRGKRQVKNSTQDTGVITIGTAQPSVAANFDIFADQLTVLDADDRQSDLENQQLRRALQRTNNQRQGNALLLANGSVCFSPASLGLFASLFIVLLLICCTVAVYFWFHAYKKVGWQHKA